MDVTSMLNTGSGAAEQQRNQPREKEDISRTPTRNRMPWDAGGYSLPLNTISSTPSTPPHISQHDDVRTFTPTSPRHKFSDSRSSLSSITSSLQSATHSRFSSMSTVGSSQPLNSLSESACESFSPRSGAPRSQSLELNAVPELYRPSVSRTHSQGSLSPTDSLAALSIGVKEALLRRQSETLPHIVGGSPMSAIMEKDSGNITPPEERPCSPSDAILIRRPTLPSLRVLTSEQDLNMNASGQAVVSRHFLSAPLENQHTPVHAKGHKRALSAPDFPASINCNFDLAGPRGQPTPPASHHPDNASPIIMSEKAPSENTPPAEASPVDTEIKCMYIPDCNTGSQLRKAISHIFGRNKMCTRLIPDHVWVHFCRKHYQRSRYRNPKNYAQLQCELVQKQIRRVHDWSSANERTGSGGVVKDWTLSMRKREQKRIDDLANGKKRPATSMDDEYDSEGYEQIQPGNLPPTAVPQWLVDRCRSGYSTYEISELFNELHKQVAEEKTYLQFPDIELLPNIIGHVEQPRVPKGHTRRASAGGQAATHKRTQSLGVAVKSEYPSFDHRPSQSSVYTPGSSNQASTNGLADPSGFSFPAQKRRRPNETIEDNSEQFLSVPSRSRLPEMGRRMQFPHRPSPMGYIPENQVGELDHYSFSPQQYQAPLAAPSPQRFNGQSMASRLETGNNYSPTPSHRSSHTRSRSDIGAMRQRSSTEQAYHEGPAEYSLPQMSEGQPTRSYLGRREEGWHPAPQQHSFVPSLARDVHHDIPRLNPNLHGLGHHRNHSTPMVPSSYAASSYKMRDPREGVAGPSNPTPQASHVTEDEHARALYSQRR